MVVKIEKEFTRLELKIACVLCIFLGVVFTLVFVQLELSPQWVTNQHCDNLTMGAYVQGIVDVANFTTITGNFTYINNGSIGTQGVEDYCIGMIQGVQNGN